MNDNSVDNIVAQQCDHVLKSNYLPYAVGTITTRAIPAIDGLKPVHRKILYVMYTMGLLKSAKTKSANIVGQTMKFHPHGDSSIYEAMVRMTIGNGSLLHPYVESKGNFGKAYSRDMAYAASRYTEAKLADICKELFDGIGEDAVDFVPNYDGKEIEPVLLPVKFPSILVNTAAGIAVGMSSNLPSYNLRDVCIATTKVLDGASSNEELLEILRGPDFPTGGRVHNQGIDFLNIIKGKGSVKVSGSIVIDGLRAKIKEIPFDTTVEAIIEKIEELQAGELSCIRDVKDGTDIKGLSIDIDFKRGTDVIQAIEKILNYTKLRSTMSFNSRVLINGVPMELSVLELLQEWIKFRLETLRRMYSFRVTKLSKQEHELAGWEIVSDNMDKLVEILRRLVKINESDARAVLMKEFGLDEIQADIFLDAKIREITADNAKKKLTKLADIREKLNNCVSLLESEELRKQQIKSELVEIANKYGKPRQTAIGGEIQKIKKEAIPIDNSDVIVAITEKGYIKKFRTSDDEFRYRLSVSNTDSIKHKFECKNLDGILVFTYSGACYKIPVSELDEKSIIAKDALVRYIPDCEKILFIKAPKEYAGSFYVVGPDGRGVAIPFDRFKHKKFYRNIYPECEPGKVWVTEEKQFFLITAIKKAAYTSLVCDEELGEYKGKFRVARLDVFKDGTIYGLQPASKVPDFEGIDTSLYEKGYFVNMKHKLW